jgi:hypothetical protein
MNKIPINELEEMTYQSLDEKRALIDRIIAENINEIIEDLLELKRRVQDLEDRGR